MRPKLKNIKQNSTEAAIEAGARQLYEWYNVGHFERFEGEAKALFIRVFKEALAEYNKKMFIK